MPKTVSIELELPHVEAVHRVLNRGELTEGPETALLESEFAHWLGVDQERVVAVSSGTSALTALLVAHRIDRAVDEVIVPAFCFTAAGLAVLRAGATPVLADVDATWTLSPEAVGEALTDRTRAVIGVDLHGVPADWDKIEHAVPEKTILIEDACPAYGACYYGDKAGTLGRDGAAFSLNESKQLPGGEGGLVVAPAKIAEKVRALRCFGEQPEAADLRRSSLPGDNWKVTEMAAAIARASLDGLSDRVMTAKLVGQEVRRAAASSLLDPHPIPDGAEPSWFKLRLSASDPGAAERAAQYLAQEGVPIRSGEVAPLPHHPLFAARGYSFPGAEKALSSFCIGSRGKPVFTASWPQTESWVKVIRSLPNELVSP